MSIELEAGHSSRDSTRAQTPTAHPKSEARRAVAGRSMLVAAVGGLRVLLIALWLGAADFFSAAVAPSVFAVLRSFNLPNANEIAGTIVTRTLSIINTGGFLIALLLLLSAFLFRRP